MGRDPEADESDRLAALYDYGMLDTPQEEAFDAITRSLAILYGVPCAFIGFVDRDRTWSSPSMACPE